METLCTYTIFKLPPQNKVYLKKKKQKQSKSKRKKLVVDGKIYDTASVVRG